MAEGGGLLNRCTVKSCTGGSNPPLSASFCRCAAKTALHSSAGAEQGRKTHLLRRLKTIAKNARARMRPHKFRHTCATRLLESGCDTAMGHSDLETTWQYLDPSEKLKWTAVSRLSLAATV